MPVPSVSSFPPRSLGGSCYAPQTIAAATSSVPQMGAKFAGNDNSHYTVHNGATILPSMRSVQVSSSSGGRALPNTMSDITRLMDLDLKFHFAPEPESAPRSPKPSSPNRSRSRSSIAPPPEEDILHDAPPPATDGAGGVTADVVQPPADGVHTAEDTAAAAEEPPAAETGPRSSAAEGAPAEATSPGIDPRLRARANDPATPDVKGGLDTSDAASPEVRLLTPSPEKGGGAADDNANAAEGGGSSPDKEGEGDDGFDRKAHEQTMHEYEAPPPVEYEVPDSPASGDSNESLDPQQWAEEIAKDAGVRVGC